MESPTTLFMKKEQRKKYEERDENLVKMMKQLELLKRHVMSAATKAINVLVSKLYDEDEAKDLDE